MQIYCPKCKRTKDETKFYGSNNTEKYAGGRFTPCKDCATMHVDNWDPSTYLWILQECDVPYMPEEWNGLLAKYGRDRSKVTGATIVGRYLAKMKLKQWKDYRWKDTAFLQELADKRTKEAMEKAGYDVQEITMAIEQSHVPIPEGELAPPTPPPETVEEEPVEDYFAQISGGSDDFIDLTEEDITYLRLKWGKAYRPEEWVRLEQLYDDMMDSYDIQTAGHKDTLILLCKASLKTNQLMDIGDIDGAKKVSQMYDTLMKSGKFTAAQNKTEQGEYVDSIGELVAICERDGFIPKYYVDGPQDKVDRVLQDMQQYTHDLITEEVGLGALIERAIQQIEEERESLLKNTGEVDAEKEEDELFDYNTDAVLKDVDFEEFAEFEEEQEEITDQTILDLMGEEFSRGTSRFSKPF